MSCSSEWFFWYCCKISAGISCNYCRIGVTGGYDGKFGQGTGAAVMEFQKQNDLEIDAIIGQDTWKAILWM